MTARPTARPIATPLARPVAGAGEGGALPLLDVYSGASLALSLRKIRTAYSGSCIRVRRSSDNVEQDFGFSNSSLDTASILAFCGASSGFVTTWYDQSGNANNATQTTTTQQPRIVNSGVLDTINGDPSLVFDGSNDWFSLPNISGNRPWSAYLVGQRIGSGSGQILGGTTTPPPALFVLNTGETNLQVSAVGAGASRFITTTTSSNALQVFSGHAQAASLLMRINGTEIASGVGTSFTAGQQDFNAFGRVGIMYSAINSLAVVMYSSDQSAQPIEAAINSLYGVY